MSNRVAALRPKRNQNIARKPRYCEIIPPNTGPIDCPIIRTVESAANYIKGEQTDYRRIFQPARLAL